MNMSNEEVLSLAKIGEATKQYITELVAAQANGDDVGDFEFCVKVSDFNVDQCEGCKLFEICNLVEV